MKRVNLHPQLLVIGAFALGCSSAPARCGPGTREEAGLCVADAVDSGQPDAAVADSGLPDAGVLPLEAEADCVHLSGGAPGPHTFAALSAVHSAVRHFGPINRLATADDTLSNALESRTVGAQTLVSYGAALAGVCVVRADSRSLPQARVERVGEIAIVHPGSGTVSVPADATAVALDLRGLPNAPGLEAALEAATGQVLVTPLARANRTVRQHQGYTSQTPGPNIYANEMVPLTRPPWPGQGSRARSLAVITGHAMPPACAELAGTLRLEGKAWVFGEPVHTSVAESSWQAFGEVGLGYRSMNLLGWPDVIAADDAASELSTLTARGTPPTITGPSARPALAAIDAMAPGPTRTLSLGSGRAALVTIHGVLRRFYPYFAVVGDRIDERLDETLAALDGASTLNRKLLFDTVSRLGEAVRDGHNFVFDVSGEMPTTGYFPVIIDQVGGEPAVAKSREPLVQPGDVIVTIAGEPASQWYARELPRTAGATAGYQFDLATRKYLDMSGPTAFGLRAIDGGVRTVTVSPSPLATLEQLYADVPRARRLGALGSPDVMYINLDRAGLDAAHPCSDAIAQAQGATGVILDMRGYPGEEAFRCVGNFARQRMMSPLFNVPVWKGPEAFSVDSSQWFVDPAAPGFNGPIVLIVGPVTVSAAETLSTLLVDAQRVKRIVGRRSAATNGNITYLRVPAAIYFSFTGMEVLHTDGGTFHGVGIVPDIEAQPTAADFATGRDRALEAALQALLAP